MICKEYNTKVYLASQTHFKVADEDEVKKLDLEIESSKSQIEELKEINSNLQIELKNITNQITDEELENQIKINRKKVKIF